MRETHIAKRVGQKKEREIEREIERERERERERRERENGYMPLSRGGLIFNR